ncbi:uncharacterized protein BYT42DRAFT_612235 [Radiomyces spectabilis]|uniref:uncharacterized protein n=1 Tax=Radiomyces spectabilis TaxID=64574 RepID=UPI002220F8F5|nr:uncharacterized protein BYT42DRAFT_612235 [Radiomyces spectabilis]KAI8384540.1 hypothetical protein BYT42DRAFT_612235 [Radiomyces spectabilis]
MNMPEVPFDRLDPGPPQLPPRTSKTDYPISPPRTKHHRLSAGASNVFSKIHGKSGQRPRSTSDVGVAESSARAAAISPQSSPSEEVNPPDEMASYYSHLHKHVRQVKRTNKSHLMPPVRADFEIRDDQGTISVQWTAFIQAWFLYLVNSQAGDRIDDRLEPFSLHVIKSSMDRLYLLLEPLAKPAKSIRRVYRWEKVWVTGASLSIYVILWYHDLLLTVSFALLIMFIISIRMDTFAQYGVEALAKDNEVPETNGRFWKKFRHHYGTQPYLGFSALEHKSLSEWRSDVKEQYGPKAQLLMNDLVDRLERLKNLITWKRPAMTRLLLCVLIIVTVVLAYMPMRYLGKLLLLWIGVEFFFLQALRSHYPTHRRAFNVIDWLLRGVPNDAEYALEVIQLRRTQPSKPKEPHHVKSRSITAPTLTVPPKPSPSQSTNSSISTADTTELVEEPDVMPGKATSTAATLATMMAAAAVDQVKQIIEERIEQDTENDDTLRKRGRQKRLSRKSTEEACDTYGCMYKGTIPGRIVLTPESLQFRTSRVTGARILVDYPWSDIVGVRKTKNIDVVIWHTNGLEITTSEGEVLRFENVVKRDDCFNQLVSLSGEQWRHL